MSDNSFTPYAIIPTPTYDQKDIKNDFGYKGQEDLPLETVSLIEQQLLLGKPIAEIAKWLKTFKK